MSNSEQLQNSLNMLYAKVENARATDNYPLLLRLLSTQALLSMQLDAGDGRERLRAAAFQIMEFRKTFSQDDNINARIALLGLPQHAGEIASRLRDGHGTPLSELPQVRDVVYATTYNLALLLENGRSVSRNQLIAIPSHRTNIAHALLDNEVGKLKAQVRRDIATLSNQLEGPYFDRPEHWAPIFSLLMKAAGKRVGCELNLPSPWDGLLQYNG